MKKILLFLCLLVLFASPVYADTHAAASCSRANVLTAYTAASNGDIITIPAGNCSSTNAWSSVLTVSKEVTIQGAGYSSTFIGISGGNGVFQIMANNVRITGITFDCNWLNNDAVGIVSTGASNGDGCGASPDYAFTDFRIDHNAFVHCGLQEETLSQRAVGTFGPAYGVIDNNVFTDCNGECITIEQGGTSSLSLSNTPGQYADNKTVYIEDNTFNYTNANSYLVDNAIDCNAGSRYVFRYNTINVNNDKNIAGMASNHDCSVGQNCYPEDNADPQLAEVYGNKVYCNGSGSYCLGSFMTQRSGIAYVYNNTVYYKDLHEGYAGDLYHLRAGHRAGCATPSYDSYTEFCHEGTKGEGLSASKTTLNGALGNNTGCPTMTSVTDFPTYGGSIIIGTEQIDYTAISTATLTPCTRGANGTTRAAHNNGVAVNLLKFGVCEGQPRQSYYWGNLYKATDGSAGVARNSVLAGSNENNPDYETYDIQSYTQRPQNWQYRNDGTAYSYTPYAYPHPLRGETDTDPPVLSSATISTNGTTLTLVFNEAVTNYTGFSISPSNTLTYSSGSGTATLVFTLTNTVYSGATDTISYTAGNVVDGASNPLATITDGSITNNSTQEASDTTAPAVTISTASGSTITSDSKTVAGTATDAVGVSGCKYRIGSDTIDATHGTACTGTTSWSCATSGYASGSNTVYVECYDAVPNYSTGHSITVTYNPPASTALLSGAVCKGCVVK